MYDLTDKQKECLIIINLFIKHKGYSPTVREIAKGMGLSSPATVMIHLHNLKNKGYISWIKGKNRTLKILKNR